MVGGLPDGPTNATVDSDFRATWLWDAGGWHRLQTAHMPFPTYSVWKGHMAFDARSQRLVLVGVGSFPHIGVCSMETWTFDGRDWRKLSPATPLPAAVRILVADGDQGVLALLDPRPALVPAGKYMPDCPAGSEAARALPAVSTWSWTGSTWTEVPGQQPPPSGVGRDTGAAVVAGHALLMTGDAAVWMWQGSGWRFLPSMNTSPQARTSAAVATDVRGHLLFGGQLQRPPWVLGDTWTWDGIAWTLRG